MLIPCAIGPFVETILQKLVVMEKRGEGQYRPKLGLWEKL